MDLSKLPKINTRVKKRVGRGIGSGKGGHTSGRGQKGQKARNKVPVYFMGAAAGASLIKRLPYLRGKGKFKPYGGKQAGLNVQFLNVLPKGTVVTVETLVKYNIATEDSVSYGVKILGGGSLNVALAVALPVSKGAKIKIEKAGGSVQGTEKGIEKKTSTKEKKKA
jgi:large subunit ribosomal protein L15